MQTALNLRLDIKRLSQGQFEGYGSTFGNVDKGGDVVVQGAFAQTLADHKAGGTMPAMFWMHRPDQVPGAWLDMREDEDGLYVKGQLAETSLGGEMRALLEMKAVRGLSIGYRTIESDFTRSGERLLKQVDLVEVSIVSLAMNPLAAVNAVKARLSSNGEYVPTEREFEGTLRDAGLSRQVARHICAKIFDESAPGGMPGGSGLREADSIDSDVTEALSKMHGLLDRIGAAALKR